jgi:hypothetical protein
MANEGRVIIKFKDIVIDSPRKEIAEVFETPDGINFHFVGGSFFAYNNQYLPSEVKQQVKRVVDSFANAKVTVDLNNLKQPVSVDMG